MKNTVKLITFVYLTFLLLLSVAGTVSGIVSEIVYYLAFIAPLVLGLASGEKRGLCHGLELDLFKLKARDVPVALSFAVPSLVLVLCVSQLSAVFIHAVTGVTDTVELSDSLILSLVEHALVPAILEELLFRYLPLRLIPRSETRYIIILSTLFFAFAHTSLFSIPYALLAGVIYIVADLLFDSVTPSLIMHFINNTVSVILLTYSDDNAVKNAVYVIIGLLFALSFVCLILNFKKKKEKLSAIFAKPDEPLRCPEILLFVAPSLLVSLISLFGA